jgi:hypothetical protein
LFVNRADLCSASADLPQSFAMTVVCVSFSCFGGFVPSFLVN